MELEYCSIGFLGCNSAPCTNEERTSQIKQMAGLRITSDMVVALSRALSLSLILVIGGAFNAGRI